MKSLPEDLRWYVQHRTDTGEATIAQEIDLLRATGPHAYRGDAPGVFLCSPCALPLLAEFCFDVFPDDVETRLDFVDARLAWGWVDVDRRLTSECCQCGRGV